MLTDWTMYTLVCMCRAAFQSLAILHSIYRPPGSDVSTQTQHCKREHTCFVFAWFLANVRDLTQRFEMHAATSLSGSRETEYSNRLLHSKHSLSCGSMTFTLGLVSTINLSFSELVVIVYSF